MVELILEANGEKLILPIPPEILVSPRENNNTVVEVVGIGEIVIPGSPKLTKRVIESYFPKERPDWISKADFKPPTNCINVINKWKNTNAIVKFTPTGLHQKSRLTIIERFDTEIRGGEYEDRYYTLELIEYRKYGAALITPRPDSTVAPVAPQRTQEKKSPVGRTYTVVKGDCLWSIAQKLSGDGNRWREMFDINRSIIGGDQVIYAGDVLKVPESWVTS